MGRSQSCRKGRSERKVTKKHYSDSSISSYSSDSCMGRSESRRKGRSERKVTKKHYSDSSYSSDSSDSRMGRSKSRHKGRSKSCHKGRSKRKVTKKHYSDSRKGRSESHLKDHSESHRKGKGRSERKVTKKHYSYSSDSSKSRKGSSESHSENVAKISKRERIIGNPYVYFGETSKILRILGEPFTTVPPENVGDFLGPPAPGEDWSSKDIMWALGCCYHIAFNSQFESLASVKIEELELNNGRGEIKDTMKRIAATYLGQRAGENYESCKKRMNSHVENYELQEEEKELS